MKLFLAFITGFFVGMFFIPADAFAQYTPAEAARGIGNAVRDSDHPHSGSNLPMDKDNDGEWEEAYLWDADGDGSSWVTCTAKDTPDSACKVAGERIYRDLSDDLSCAVMDCGFGVMAPSSILRFETGVHVAWPCWDAQNPTVNDPTATDDTAHDDLADPAFLDCPLDPYSSDDASARLVGAVLKFRNITLIGSGVDYRLNDTSLMGPGTDRPLGRTIGTTFVDDMGNGGTITSVNDWFTIDYKMAILNLGPMVGSTIGGNGGRDNGQTYSGAGAYTGWTTIDNAGVDITVPDDVTGQLCLCDTSACAGTYYRAKDGSVADGAMIDQLDRGDLLMMKINQTLAATRTVKWGAYMLDDGVDAVQGSCTADAREVSVGIKPLNGADVLYTVGGVGDGYAEVIEDGAKIGVVDSDFLNTRVWVKNITFEPQDYPGEAGGDCTSSVPWQDSTGTTDTWACDTHHIIRLNGSNNGGLDGIVVKNHANYGIDGDSTYIKPTVKNVDFYWSRGKGVVDGHWPLRNIRVHGGNFSSVTASMWGGWNEVVNYHVTNTSAITGLDFGQGQVHGFFRNIRFENHSIRTPIELGCGAQFNVIEMVSDAGRVQSFDTAFDGYDQATVYLRSSAGGCADGSEIFGNSITNVWTDLGPWRTGVNGGSVLFGISIDDTNPKADLDIYGNSFSDSGFYGSGGNSGCIVGVSEQGGNGDQGESYVFSKNFFSGLTSTDNSTDIFGVLGGSGLCDSAIDSADGSIDLATTGVPNACGITRGKETFNDDGVFNCSGGPYAPGVFYIAAAVDDCDDLPDGTTVIVSDDAGSCADTNGVLTAGGTGTPTECRCAAGTWLVAP